MELEFIKANGQGNDYIFFNLLDKPINDLDYQELAKSLSRHHFSIGGDGVVLILPDKENDCFIRIFNSDGSEARNCGTALRCTAMILYQITNKTEQKIRTLSGSNIAKVTDPVNQIIDVDMNDPKLLESGLSFMDFNGYLVDVGNPHLIFITKTRQKELLKKKGNELEYSIPKFGRVNVEFVQIISRNEIVIDIWERGSGTTLACGTGATATSFLANHLSLIDDEVIVNMPGGKITIKIKNNRFVLSGNVEIPFTGKIVL